MVLLIYDMIELWLHALKYFCEYMIGLKAARWMVRRALQAIKNKSRMSAETVIISNEDTSKRAEREATPGRFYFEFTESVHRHMRMYDDHKDKLVLDLDETLVHSSGRKLDPSAEVIEVHFKETTRKYFLHKRSFLQEFLESCAEHFDLFIYTASRSEYAEEVMRIIDPRKLVKNVFCRDHCYFDGK